jgi:hypothetical protein
MLVIGRSPSGGVNLVRVVPRCERRRTTRHATSLSVALLRVVPLAAPVEVVVLHVERVLGEAEVVRPVVHAVVHGEQVRPGGVDVVARRRLEHGR